MKNIDAVSLTSKRTEMTQMGAASWFNGYLKRDFIKNKQVAPPCEIVESECLIRQIFTPHGAS